jgi:hypothetical protein
VGIMAKIKWINTEKGKRFGHRFWPFISMCVVDENFCTYEYPNGEIIYEVFGNPDIQDNYTGFTVGISPPKYPYNLRSFRRWLRKNRHKFKGNHQISIDTGYVTPNGNTVYVTGTVYGSKS